MCYMAFHVKSLSQLIKCQPEKSKCQVLADNNDCYGNKLVSGY